MIIKCKMCGGDLNIGEGNPICECEFCGTQQTIPQADSEKKANLFNRANRLRMNAEFDKAAAVYASITAEFPEEAEAYWGLCLCKYGIEYVDDPLTGNKIPTCHRTLPESIMDDSDFEQACENADGIARRLYREEAKQIDRLQQDILSIVASEAAYDVFICYKETAEDGERTEDSVLAQEIYESLNGKGLHVFFSRITLEDKLGREYEPYIYAALHSAKVMLAVGTKFEYYDAVWVKNEWMRFLSMMKTEKGKTLIPCYKDLDAYDMPREFKNLQGQDMGKLGWLQDLTRGVLKLCGKDKQEAGNGQAAPVKQIISGGPNADSLIQRARLFLEDRQWNEAASYADKALDMEPTNARAYLIKLMAERKVSREEQLAEEEIPLQQSGHYQKVLRFDEAGDTSRQLKQINQTILNRNETNRKSKILQDAKVALEKAINMEQLVEIRKMLERIADFDGVADFLEKCEEKEKRIQLLIQAENQAELIDGQILELKEKIAEIQQQKQKTQANREKAEKDLESGKTQINKYRSEVESLEREKENLRGLFSGKKRAELETQISEKKGQMNRAETECKNTEAELAKLEEKVKKLTDEELTARESENNLLYQIGQVYYEKRIYQKAAIYFMKIRGNRDVEQLLKTDESLFTAVVAREAELAPYKTIGSIVTFGKYQQNNNTNNGPEAIEWLVLDVQNGKSLLLSRYGLDAKPYNTEWWKDTAWEECSLRAWLNNDFLKGAFTPTEQSAILLTAVDNSKSQGYSDWSTNGGNNTQDHLFLLSYAEANKYLGVTYDDSNNTKSRVAPTAYAKVQGAYTNDDNKTVDGEAAGWWWLRSPGSFRNSAAYVYLDGSLLDSGVNSESVVVRPAFWLNLKSDIF